ncbi:hypothetical protein GCM10023067_53980 [Aminobacter aganoensis]
MPDQPREQQKIADLTIRRLMKETGITEDQARKLVADLGHEWPTLVREARFLAKKR